VLRRDAPLGFDQWGFGSRNNKLTTMTTHDICPECGSEMILFDSGSTKIHGRSYSFQTFKCINPDCGFIDSNEPDPDENYDSRN